MIATMLTESRPLRASDLLAGAAYEAERAQIIADLLAHKRHRRLSFGDWGCLVFESRATAWFQSQEELRFHPCAAPGVVADVLARNNALVARPGELRATLLIERAGPRGVDLATLANAAVPLLRLDLGDRRFMAETLVDDAEAASAVVFMRLVPVGRGTLQACLYWPPLEVMLPLPEAVAAPLRAEAAARPRERSVDARPGVVAEAVVRTSLATRRRRSHR